MAERFILNNDNDLVPVANSYRNASDDYIHVEAEDIPENDDKINLSLTWKNIAIGLGAILLLKILFDD